MKTRLARHIRSQGVVVVVTMLAMLAGSQSASATVMTTTLDVSFGAGGAGGTSFDVIIDDEGTDDSVKLTFDLTNLIQTGVTRVKNIYLNYDGPTLTSGDFGTWSGDTPVINVCLSAPTCTDNDFKAGGDGIFDLLFEFPSSVIDPNVFLSPEMTMVTISLTGIKVNDFIGLSEPGGSQGPFCMAAHIISGTGQPANSDFLGAAQCISVPEVEMPEPASLLLFGIGLLGLGVFARRRRFAA